MSTPIRYGDAGVSPRTNVYAAREMLRHALPVIILGKMGLTKPLPKNKTQTIRFRRPNIFTAATTPLVEGVTPPSRAFTFTDVDANLQQYGDWSEVTDVIEDTHEDPVIKEVAQQHGQNIGRTMEQLAYGVVRSGTSVTFANGTARNQVTRPINLRLLRASARKLRNNKADMINQVVDASMKTGTRSVEKSWVVVCHTDCENDIRAIEGFVPCNEYGQKSKICDEEIGSVESFRFCISPDLPPFEDAGGAVAGTGMLSTSGTSCDVYPMLVFGKDAWGHVPLKGKEAVTPTIIPTGRPEKSDPLAQRGSVGWKAYYTAVILNDAWMDRVEVAVTDLAD